MPRFRGFERRRKHSIEDEHCIGSLRQTFLSGGLGNDEHEHQEHQVSILESTPKKNKSQHREIQNCSFRARAREAPKVSLSFRSLKKAWEMPNNISDT